MAVQGIIMTETLNDNEKKLLKESLNFIVYGGLNLTKLDFDDREERIKNAKLVFSVIDKNRNEYLPVLSDIFTELTNDYDFRNVEKHNFMELRRRAFKYYIPRLRAIFQFESLDYFISYEKTRNCIYLLAIESKFDRNNYNIDNKDLRYLLLKSMTNRNMLRNIFADMTKACELFRDTKSGDIDDKVGEAYGTYVESMKNLKDLVFSLTDEMKECNSNEEYEKEMEIAKLMVKKIELTKIEE
ncbi:hypothetical protein FACS1894152_5510 [Bacilli bacterium]|nr:hypothetical protein FACS1894152_5510 [Bacilli bacterium]